VKELKDNFSKQAGYYKKYRPTYPKELFEDILDLCGERAVCWDCGTGNGQVAKVLSEYFKKVYATDISAAQLSKATQDAKITYSVERAEQTTFKNDQFDLITVAQAIHWFDFKDFNKELSRVAKNGAIIAIWGYGLLRIDSMIDTLINSFYKDVVGPYWDKEREHIDNSYQTIPLYFKELRLKRDHTIKTKWTLHELDGYLNTWSSVQNYMAEHQQNPVPQLIEKIGHFWDDNADKDVTFPIFTRIGTIEK